MSNEHTHCWLVTIKKYNWSIVKSVVIVVAKPAASRNKEYWRIAVPSYGQCIFQGAYVVFPNLQGITLLTLEINCTNEMGTKCSLSENIFVLSTEVGSLFLSNRSDASVCHYPYKTKQFK